MNAAQIELAITIIRTLSSVIASKMKQYNELVDLFERANQEDRDFTDEEVAIFERRAEAALKELEETISEM